MGNNYIELGKRIRAIRKSKKLTLEQLSEMIGKTGQYLGNIERAEGIPSLNTVISIANALGVSMDMLLQEYLHEHSAELKPTKPNIYSPLLSKLKEMPPAKQRAIFQFICKMEKE